MLEAESGRAQLLVLGHRGLGGVTGLLLGSVTVALAAHAACPVVVVRGAHPLDASPQLPVVIGVHGTPNSEAAIAFAFAAADARQVPLIGVHTWWDSVAEPVGPVLTPRGAPTPGSNHVPPTSTFPVVGRFAAP